MAEIEKRPVKIVETVLVTPTSLCSQPECLRTRCCPLWINGSRSATMRLSAGAELPLIPCLRFLKEDPWERLKETERRI